MDILSDEPPIFFSYFTLFLVPVEVRIRIIFEILISWLSFSPVCHRQARTAEWMRRMEKGKILFSV
jgi:hypothetical protein